MNIAIKRAYDEAAVNDGYRVLVDRLWPRGVKKEALQVDEWLKEIAPSTELREWFVHDPAKFSEFKKRYIAELSKNNLANELLKRAKDSGTLTLIYSAKDTEHNQAVVLADHLKTLK